MTNSQALEIAAPSQELFHVPRTLRPPPSTAILCPPIRSEVQPVGRYRLKTEGLEDYVVKPIAIRSLPDNQSPARIPDVAASSSEADHVCNCGPGTVGDFVTGGGWITDTPSGAKGTFGVAGGIKPGGFWGHLTYQDYRNGMKVKATSITSYAVTGAASRRITGTAEVNGARGFAFTVDVADNAGPGGSDTFSISLSNGYVAGGTLPGGNIQLHTPGKGSIVEDP